MIHGDCAGFSVVSSTNHWAGVAGSIESEDWVQKLLGYVARRTEQGAKGIYLRVTTVDQEPQEHRRGSADDSVSLPALWADMDIAGPGHKPIKATPANPNPLPLPPDEDTCLRII